MSERDLLEFTLCLEAKMLRQMQLAGLANVDDVLRLNAAIDALLAYETRQFATVSP